MADRLKQHNCAHETCTDGNIATSICNATQSTARCNYAGNQKTSCAVSQRVLIAVPLKCNSAHQDTLPNMVVQNQSFKGPTWLLAKLPGATAPDDGQSWHMGSASEGHPSSSMGSSSMADPFGPTTNRSCVVTSSKNSISKLF